MSNPSPAERFWAKVEQTDNCWLWTAYIDRGGYGRFAAVPQTPVLAHRYAYELMVGPIPDGMSLDHLCRVRRCVNPEHLEPVPQIVNTRRGTSARRAQRTHCMHGHPFSPDNTRMSRAPYLVTPLCGIARCGRPHHGRGLCTRHYMEWYRSQLPDRRPWSGSDQGHHQDCGGRLTGLICTDGSQKLRWAQCDRCGLKGEPV